MDGHHHHNKPVYIVTEDLGRRIQGLRSLGLDTPGVGHRIFVDFHNQLKENLSKMLPDVSVITYDMEDLATRVWSTAMRARGGLKDAIVVSSCLEVSSPRRGHTIEINRIVDENGDIIGLGPRPGHVALSRQFDSFATMANGNPVVLIEDGAFSGTTLDYVLEQLQKRHVNVATVVVGICFEKALEKIRRNFRGEVVIVEEVDSPYEWMPDHDFIPFSPNCGRVFGGVFGQDTLPYYTHDELSYSLPYILPFGDPVNWASIPKDSAGKFSSFCLQKALELFQMIEEMNGRKIGVRELGGSTPRVSIPMTKGSRQLPEISGSIAGFLSEVCHEF